MKHLKIAGAALAVILALAVAVIGQPTLDEKVEEQSADLTKILDSRAVYVDSAELLDLIYNNNMATKIIDVRDETDYNLFHIKDSDLVTMDQIRDPSWVRKLPKQTVIMIVSNGEARATEAWKLLKVQKVRNIYILEAGVNNWLSRYSDLSPKPDNERKPGALNYTFDLALGANNPAADPDPEQFPEHEYVKKVEHIGKAVKKAGGCG